MLKSEDKAAIDAKSQALAQVAQKLGEKMYADAQTAGETAAPGAKGEARPDESEVVDAEYTEVKDGKK